MGVEDRNDVPFTSGHDGTVSPGGSVHRVQDARASTWATEPSRHAMLRRTIRGFLMRDDGYLRIIPGDGGKSAYCKFKFTNGRWGGYYVMTVGNADLVDDLLDMLLQKCDEVDANVRRPTKDVPYGT